MLAVSYNFSGNISFVNSTSTTAIYILQAYPNSVISGNLSFVNNTFKEGEGQDDGTNNIISGNILFVNI